MATYYWVSDGITKSGDWSDINHWSLTSNGPGGAGVPTKTDDVIINASSGAATDVITVNSGECRNLTANATSTVVHIEVYALDIYGNVALGSSFTFDDTFGTISFYVTNGATNTINLANKPTYNSLFFSFDPVLTPSASNVGTFSITGGISTWYDVNFVEGVFNTNNNAIAAGTQFIIADNVIGPTVVNMGSSTVTIGTASNLSQLAVVIAGDPIYLSNVYSVTFNCGTSIFNIGSSTVAAQKPYGSYFIGLNSTFNRVNFFGSFADVYGANTFAILTYTTSATVLTDVFSGCAYLSLNNNQTITSNYSVSGNSTIQRLHVVSSVVGSTRTLTIPATRTSNNVDFRDITISGTTLSGTSLGNMLGNTNITFTAAVTRYARNTNTNFSSTTSWATTSGGAAGASVPLAQDNIIFDINSSYLYGDMINLGNNITVNSNYPVSFLFDDTARIPLSGDLDYYLFGTLDTPSTCGIFNNASRADRLFLCDRTTRTLNTTIFTTDTMISAPGATVTLAGDTTFRTNGPLFYCDFGVVAGTLNTNNYTINARFITVKPAYIGTNATGLFGYPYIQGLNATYNFGSSTINLYRNEYSPAKPTQYNSSYIYFGYEFDYQYSFNVTVNAGTSNIYLWNNVDQGDQSRTTSVVISIYGATTTSAYITNPTFYNLWLASTLSSGTCAYLWSAISLSQIASINTLGIHTSYAPTTLTVFNTTGIVCNNIDSTNAGPNNGLIICAPYPLNNQTSSALNRTTLTCNNNITTNYVSYRNVDCDSGQITAYGVANLGNNTGNFFWASPVAVAAFTTTGNYTVSMPTNFSGSAVAVVVSGGGGGSRRATAGQGGSGGGGSSIAYSNQLNVVGGSTLYITVGAGGPGPIAPSTATVSGGVSWISTISNTRPAPYYGAAAYSGTNGGGGGAGGLATNSSYWAYAPLSYPGGLGGTGDPVSGGGGGGGGGSSGSFNTSLTTTNIRGGAVSGFVARGGAGGGGVEGRGDNTTSSELTGQTGGIGYNATPGGAAGISGTLGSGGGGGTYSASAGVTAQSGGSSATAGDVTAWFVNGVAGYVPIGSGGGGGGGGAATAANTFGGNGGAGVLGGGGGGAGGSATALYNGNGGNGGDGYILLLYSVYMPVTYATILGED